MNNLPASHPIASVPLVVETPCAVIHVESITEDYVQLGIESGGGVGDDRRVSVQVGKSVHVHYVRAAA